MATDNHPKLSDDAAGKLLANVFDACGQEPNTIPLPKLASYSEYRREKYSFQKILLAVVLLVFCLLPLCFIAPSFDIVQISPDTAKSPTYEIRIKKGPIPISLVAASVDGRGVEVYETGDRTFSVSPVENGTLSIKVTLANKQHEMKSISVTGVDITPPVLINQRKVNDLLYIYLEDEGLGIDWDAIYGETLSGVTVYPIGQSIAEGYIVFDFPAESMNIYVPDLKGNILQLVLTTT